MFSIQRQSGAFVHTSTKLRQRNGCGQRSGESAWLFVISAVSAMKKNGARNAIAKPIKTAWFATASRKRRRRTAAGTRRRASGAVVAVAVIGRPLRSAPTCVS